MYRVSKEISFCYGHRLLEHKGKCRHLHGHNARAVITLETPGLNDEGMVMDFSDVESTMKAWIDRELDHTMLLHENDPFLPSFLEARERVYVMPLNPTAENIARLIFDQAESAGLPVVEVTIWETGSACASYRKR